MKCPWIEGRTADPIPWHLLCCWEVSNEKGIMSTSLRTVWSRSEPRERPRDEETLYARIQHALELGLCDVYGVIAILTAAAEEDGSDTSPNVERI